MTQISSGWHIRRGDTRDLPFLRAMLYEAAFWRPERSRPDLTTALAEPHLARYLGDWGRDGDIAVIAEDALGNPAGAAWYRLFDVAAPGYGFLDAATPEITIGVVADRRGRGVGAALLTALLREAVAAGVGALSLSVEPTNPALRLYQRHGFERVSDSGGAWTMRTGTTGRISPDASEHA